MHARAAPLFATLALAACPAPQAPAPPTVAAAVRPLSTVSATSSPPPATEPPSAAPPPSAPVAPTAAAGPLPTPSAEQATPSPSASGAPLFTRDQRVALYGACTEDDDCVVTSFGSCCSPCRSAPRAMRVTELRARQELCGHVDCAPPVAPCAPVEDASAYRAVCRDGACDAVRTGSGIGTPGR